MARIDWALERPAYNLVLHTAPFSGEADAAFHWHLEILPRVTRFSGLEWGSGVHRNPVSPEEAARVLRELSLQGSSLGATMYARKGASCGSPKRLGSSASGCSSLRSCVRLQHSSRLQQLAGRSHRDRRGSCHVEPAAGGSGRSRRRPAIWLFISGFVPSMLHGRALVQNDLAVGAVLVGRAILSRRPLAPGDGGLDRLGVRRSTGSDGRVASPGTFSSTIRPRAETRRLHSVEPYAVLCRL